MDLNVLLWILGGGFAGTWGLCIFFMNRTDNNMNEMRKENSNALIEIRKEITEIRNETSAIRSEISALYHCVKDHHGRLCTIEERNKQK